MAVGGPKEGAGSSIATAPIGSMTDHTRMESIAGHTSQRDILSSIANVFTTFFNIQSEEETNIADSDGRHRALVRRAVAPSDILLGFALVEAWQRQRKRAGDQFLHAERSDRWSASIVYSLDRSARKSMTAGTNMEEREAIDRDSDEKKIPSNPITTTIPSDILPTSYDTNSQCAVSPFPSESTMINDVLSGKQPSLQHNDWDRIAAAKYYAKYAQGAYGWMLYTFDHPSCICGCAALRCFSFNGGALPRDGSIRGSGIGLCCCPPHQRCAQWSLNTFLYVTKLKEEDLLYCHIAESPIFYVALDRKKRSLIIAVRGTLSLADTVTDLDAALHPLDAFNYRHCYTHTGMLENALRVYEQLDESGWIDRIIAEKGALFDQVILCGHSLGAGTASLLTYLWKDRFRSSGKRLHCFAYAPPLVANPSLAVSSYALSHITSIIYSDDIIPRLSLANLLQLKNQMAAAFQFTAQPSKFDIMTASLKRNLHLVFKNDQNQQQNNNDYQHVHSQSAQSDAYRQSSSTASSSSSSSALSSAALDDVHGGLGSIPSFTSADPMAGVDSSLSSHVRPLLTAGRVYHIITKQKKKSSARGWCSGCCRLVALCIKTGLCLCCGTERRESIIYPAHHRTFQEIVITKTIFHNHLPRMYTMNDVDVPDHYALDDDEH